MACAIVPKFAFVKDVIIVHVAHNISPNCARNVRPSRSKCSATFSSFIKCNLTSLPLLPFWFDALCIGVLPTSQPPRVNLFCNESRDTRGHRAHPHKTHPDYADKLMAHTFSINLILESYRVFAIARAVSPVPAGGRRSSWPP